MKIVKKAIAFSLIVCMVGLLCCFHSVDTVYAASKVTSVTLTNVGDLYTIKKGKSFKLKYSIEASKKKYKKVKWKSSNKKVLTVSKKGVIKARKKGVAYVTCYAKYNKKKKDKVKIRVGYPVSSITIEKPNYYVAKGDTTTIPYQINPSNASYKNISWASSDPEIASISSDGIVTGHELGSVIITASSTDGRNVETTVSLKVVYLKKGDAVFVAHRGYSSMAPENTIPAFEQAAVNNFDAAEMDIWESPVGDDDVDLMIMHDASINRMCGIDIPTTSVNTTNREDYPIIAGNNIDTYAENGEVLLIPTLDEALEALYSTNPNTKPVIEIKPESISDVGIVKLLDGINRYGGEATVVSFKEESLEAVQDAIVSRGLEDSIDTMLLTSSPTEEIIDYCASRGYTGISISHKKLTAELAEYVHSKDLALAAWTVGTQAEVAELIDLGVTRITSNYKLFVDGE